jgi:hypothetical protein
VAGKGRTLHISTGKPSTRHMAWKSESPDMPNFVPGSRTYWPLSRSTTEASCLYSHALRAVHHRPCCGAVIVIQSPSCSSSWMNFRSATRTYSDGAAVTCASSKKT